VRSRLDEPGRWPAHGAAARPASSRRVTQRHPDLLPAHRDKLAETLRDPDQIRRSPRFPNARVFSRRFDTVGLEKHAVVVVVSDLTPELRH
jgi:hypothetical protein